MKRMLIVNNNLAIGGVQKALVNFANVMCRKYEITLLLFTKSGELLPELDENIRIISCDSLFKYLGKSQAEYKNNTVAFLIRGFLAFLTKFFGRGLAMSIILASQRKIDESFDIAISYLQNGRKRVFYGGCNEFVLNKVKAPTKISFIHCDYVQCGANNRYNNRLYKRFDRIIACSKETMMIFAKANPAYCDKCFFLPNCHNYSAIESKAQDDPIIYDKDYFNIVAVARLTHEKGIGRAIAATKNAIDSGYKVMLHVVGDGPDAFSLRQEINIGYSKYIILHGKTDNPYRYMKNANLLLITSYHEAAPMIIDEANVLGLPVLSTQTSSSQSMIIDRNIGWVCGQEQNEINSSLCSIIEKYLRDPEKFSRQIPVNLRSNQFVLDQFERIIN